MTPAATSRSQTSWATSAGVAMTPIVICCSATIASQVANVADDQAADGRADTRAVGVDRAAMRNPREANPA